MVTAAVPPYLAAIDQGTTSTRCLIVDHAGTIVGRAQGEHTQSFPRPGWVEHDPAQIWQTTCQVIGQALADAGLRPSDLAGCGVANQRETAVAWDRHTGQPVHPAIVWQDLRTEALCEQLAADGGTDRFRDRTGLPLSTYFTGPKLTWMLQQVPGLRDRAEAGHVLAGTIDSWLIWNLTGGPRGGQHVTDVTNASRTLLMGLDTLDWDPDLLAAMQIPAAMLATICPSAHIYGYGAPDGPLPGVPMAAALGDQQAALIGQGCFTAGSTKATYGTGTFLVRNTGTTPVRSRHGLLTTVAYQLGAAAPVYALEGSVAVAGSLIQWMRDDLELFDDVADVEPLAAAVPDTGGVYLVPAFSGLFAPRWRPDARGVVTGLTRYARKAHLVRAALEATCYQTREITDAMHADTTDTADGAESARSLDELRVDGGMVANSLLMQLQADTLGIPVTAPAVPETTALGAAFAAGLAVGAWSDTDELAACRRRGRTWQPTAGSPLRGHGWTQWNRAVQRAFGWADSDDVAGLADPSATPNPTDLISQSPRGAS